MADSWHLSFLHRKLDAFAQRYCPILKQILGKKLNGNYQDEMGNRYNVRIETTTKDISWMRTGQPLPTGHGSEKQDLRRRRIRIIERRKV